MLWYIKDLNTSLTHTQRNVFFKMKNMFGLIANNVKEKLSSPNELNFLKFVKILLLTDQD